MSFLAPSIPAPAVPPPPPAPPTLASTAGVGAAQRQAAAAAAAGGAGGTIKSSPEGSPTPQTTNGSKNLFSGN
jgi:hypothetical protein